jgi:hypothetical protein
MRCATSFTRIRSSRLTPSEIGRTRKHCRSERSDPSCRERGLAAAVHWNGQTWRFLPSDFEAYSRNRERYGEDSVDGPLTVQDWGISY